MKLLIKAPINPHSGYGNDGIGMVVALQQLGFDVYLDPMFVQAPLPPEVAMLLTKRLVPPFDLLINHTDPAQLCISAGARRTAKFTVAWTMWEMSTLGNCAGRSRIRERARSYDLVVGYDQVTTEAMRPYVTTSAATVQGGYWPEQWPRARRDFYSPTFNFCMVGALGPRKDPFIAIDAFRELREEHPELDIRLNLKTVTPGLHAKLAEAIPGLTVYYETWTTEELYSFYRDNHVLLAPSRGEGKNMPALEMLSTGGTVIATNWGGHTGWLSSTVGFPLNYTLGPVSPQTPNCLWAKADKQHLKDLMYQAATNRTLTKSRGDTAADLIPQMCAWSRVIDRLMVRIGATNSAGAEIHANYRRMKAFNEERSALAALV